MKLNVLRGDVAQTMFIAVLAAIIFGVVALPKSVLAVAPTVSLSASPASIPQGQSTTLTWSSTDATSCMASGGWADPKATSGSQSVTPGGPNTSYILTCTGPDGSANTTVWVPFSAAPAPSPLPTVTLTASPSSFALGQSTTLTWSSTDATSCTASGGWSGTKSTSGSQSDTPTGQNTTYTLTCTGAGGSASANAATFTTASATTQTTAAPTVTLIASPASIASGQSTTLTWSSTDATSCTASGGWSGTKSTSGSASVTPGVSNTSYTITCTGASGSANTTVWVPFSAAPAPSPLPTVTLTASPSSFALGQSTTLTWSSTDATSCTASGGWSGTKSTSGSQSDTPTGQNTTYTLTCTGAGGSASANAATFTTASATTQTTPTTPTTSTTPAIGSSTGAACTGLSIDCAVSQNSGFNTGVYPFGVPVGYSWYDGGSASYGFRAPPGGWTALTGWGQVYPQVGATNIQTNVYMRNFKTYVHLTSGGWRLVQSQAVNNFEGGQFVADFSGNTGAAFTSTKLADGSSRIVSPPSGYNMHFWMVPRGTFTANTINGVFVIGEMRVDNPSANIIGNFGGDWWRDAGIGYVHPVGTNNQEIGISSWIKLNTNYQYFYYTNLTRSELQGDPPPPLAGTPSSGTPTIPSAPTAPLPTVTLTASPSSFALGQSTTLTWSSTDATSCTASGGWSGTKSTSGSQSDTPTGQNTTYTLTCTGAGGSASANAATFTTASATTQTTPTTPTTFSMNDRVHVSSGPLNVRASANSAGTLLGSQPDAALGTVIGGPTVQGGFTWWQINYDTGVDGWSAEEFLAKVPDAQPQIPIVPAAPSVTFFTSLASITTGQSPTLQWSSTNASLCTASGGWSGAKSVSGTHMVTPTANTSFTITCSGAGGSAVATIDITVTSPTITVADTQAPTIPIDVRASVANTSQINLAWSPSTDNIGVTSYQVFRNGTQVGSPTDTAFIDTGLSAATAYTYTVRSVDAAGNLSASSVRIDATTPAAPATRTITQYSPSSGGGGGGLVHTPSRPLSGAVSPGYDTGASESRPTNTATIFLRDTLAPGKEHEDVQNLQRFLIAENLLTIPNGIALGTYGPATEKAVAAFQKRENIVTSGTADTTGLGLVGPKTLAYINTYLASRPALLTVISSSTKPVIPATNLTTSSGVSFTKPMQIGIRDAQVMLLQKLLNARGFTVSTSGPGSTGNETTYFGPATHSAVAKLQVQYGIATTSTSLGLVGPRTRATLNELLRTAASEQ